MYKTAVNRDRNTFIRLHRAEVMQQAMNLIQKHIKFGIKPKGRKIPYTTL